MISLLGALWAAEPPDLAGTWAMELSVATKVVLPVIGGLANWTNSSLLVEIRREGDQWVQSHRTCAVVMGSSPALARTVVPDAFIAALPTRSYPLSLRADGEGWTSLADPGPLAVGFDPGAGPMPTSVEAAAIRDFDGDGQPGASVEVEVPMVSLQGQVWVVQNGHTVFRGESVSEQEISGRAVVVRLEQYTLGATHPWLVSNPKIVVVPEKSRFVMRRAPTGADCGVIKTSSAP
jgi:hypothetical protein